MVHKMYWIRLLATAWLVVGASEAGSAAQLSPPLVGADVEAWFDGFVPRALHQGKIAGAVVVVVKDGQVLLKKGYGYADVADNIPVDPDTTLFRPGSVSKLFTWTAVMQLVEQGRLDLDRDVNEYLDFKIPATHPEPVTLRNLMRHMPGFEETARGLYMFDPRGLEPLELYVKNHIPRRIYPPGRIPAYSNYGTSLAGYIVQRVSGEPFHMYVAKHIFGPLGMGHSSFQQPLPPHLLPQMAQGYETRSQDPWPFELFGPSPAGGLSSSGADMARFMISYLQEGQYDGRRIVRPETVHLMYKPAFESPPGVNGMGLGFYHMNRHGLKIVGHGGNTHTFHTQMRLILEHDVGVFVSFNSRGRNGAVFSLIEGLLDGFIDRYFPAAVIPATSTLISSKHGQLAEGLYKTSRRWESSFFSILNLLQDRVTMNDDGTLVVSGVVGINNQPKRWREVEPLVWQELHGPDRLAMMLEDGDVTSVRTDQATALLRAPVWMSSAWNVPLLIGSVVVMLLTVLHLPIATLVRRHYGAARSLEPRDVLAYRLSRAAALVAVLFFAGWAAVFQRLMTNHVEFFNAGSDPWFRLLHLGGLLCMAGTGAIVWNSVRTWQRPSGIGERIWTLVLPVAALATVWFIGAFRLISISLDY
jgi:CubicO group peptidase (beta-lactamase class C family)